MLVVLTLFSLAVWAYIFYGTWHAHRNSYKLESLGDLGRSDWPPLQIIVAARNEEKDIEDALMSLLKLDYPNYKVTVVNDRSTDGTGLILNRLSSAFPDKLKIKTVRQLPQGWLGKNHALHFGVFGDLAGDENSFGEWILFTDADVKFDPTTLTRAISFSEDKKFDHLCLSPLLIGGSPLLKAIHSFFALMFGLIVRPQSVETDPKRFVGIGAFNLVRKSFLVKMKGLEEIRLRPDDDLMLGKLVKKYKGSQGFAFGGSLLTLQWYKDVKETMYGLEKNIFAGFEYSLLRFFGVQILGTLATVPAYFFLFLPNQPVLFLSLGAQAFLFCSMYITGRFAKNAPWSAALLFPLAASTLAFIAQRSIFLALKRGGVYWRDTFYSLKDLKSNRVNLN